MNTIKCAVAMLVCFTCRLSSRIIGLCRDTGHRQRLCFTHTYS